MYTILDLARLSKSTMLATIAAIQKTSLKGRVTKGPHGSARYWTDAEAVMIWKELGKQTATV